MKKDRKLILISVLMFVLILLSACSSGGQNDDGSNNTAINEPAANEPAQTNEEEPTDEPYVAPEPEMDTVSSDIYLDPALVALDDTDSLMVSAYVYEGLVNMDADGNIFPGIAASWEVSDDGLSYEFKLRTDAVFSDGNQISTDLILENFNRWFDPEHPQHGSDNDVYQAWFEYFKGFRDEVDADDNPISLFDGIEKVDDLRFLIHLNEDMPDFLEIISLAHFSILDPSRIDPDAYGKSMDTVVGSGPYEISEWTDSSLVLSPSDSYWGTQPEAALEFTVE